MKKSVKRLCCILLTMILCIGMTVPAMAASSKYNAAVASYRRYMSGKCGSYIIVDIDGNGVPELIFHNKTDYTNELRTYNPKQRKTVRLARVGMGKGYNMPAKYSKKTHTVLLPSANTGGSIERIYRVKGTKASRVCTLEGRNNKHSQSGAWVNGKKVSNATYNRTFNKYMKNYYIVYWR